MSCFNRSAGCVRVSAEPQRARQLCVTVRSQRSTSSPSCEDELIPDRGPVSFPVKARRTPHPLDSYRQTRADVVSLLMETLPPNPETSGG
jgi:hypothetical protein